MTVNTIGTSVIFGTLLATGSAKGKDKTAPAAKKTEDPKKMVKECVEQDSQEHPVQAQACFARVLEANPDYADDQLKDVTTLPPAEWQQVDNLCRAIMNRYFAETNVSEILMKLLTSYHYLPKADGSGMASVVNGKKLASPLKVFTAVPRLLFSWAPDYAERKAKVIADLKKQAPLVVATDGSGKSYRIVKALVRIEEDQFVTTSGSTYAGVTIVPLRVSVFEQWQKK